MSSFAEEGGWWKVSREEIITVDADRMLSQHYWVSGYGGCASDAASQASEVGNGTLLMMSISSSASCSIRLAFTS